jgi:hypothetical protein
MNYAPKKQHSKTSAMICKKCEIQARTNKIFGQTTASSREMDIVLARDWTFSDQHENKCLANPRTVVALNDKELGDNR